MREVPHDKVKIIVQYQQRPLRHHLCSPLTAVRKLEAHQRQVNAYLSLIVRISSSLRSFGRLQLCAEHAIPESACDAEAVLIIGKVVLHVIFSKLAIV